MCVNKGICSLNTKGDSGKLYDYRHLYRKSLFPLNLIITHNDFQVDLD